MLSFAAALLQELEAKQRSNAKAAGTAGIGLAAGLGPGGGARRGRPRRGSLGACGAPPAPRRRAQGGPGLTSSSRCTRDGVLPAGGLGLPQELNTSRSRSLAGGEGNRRQQHCLWLGWWRWRCLRRCAAQRLHAQDNAANGLGAACGGVSWATPRCRSQPPDHTCRCAQPSSFTSSFPRGLVALRLHTLPDNLTRLLAQGISFVSETLARVCVCHARGLRLCM